MLQQTPVARGETIWPGRGAPRPPAAADRLGSGVRIDVIYCGPDHDKAGMAFMRKLARGGGAAHHHSITRAPERLAPAVRLLALPGR